MLFRSDTWLEHGYDHGVSVGPFDEIIKAFRGRPARLSCIWQQNCANEFISIDARGQTALCDCWVTSYPEHSFGNVLGTRCKVRRPGIGSSRQGSRIGP